MLQLGVIKATNVPELMEEKVWPIDKVLESETFAGEKEKHFGLILLTTALSKVCPKNKVYLYQEDRNEIKKRNFF